MKHKDHEAAWLSYSYAVLFLFFVAVFCAHLHKNGDISGWSQDELGNVMTKQTVHLTLSANIYMFVLFRNTFKIVHTALLQISQYLTRLRLAEDFKDLAHSPILYKSYSLPSWAQGHDVNSYPKQRVRSTDEVFWTQDYRTTAGTISTDRNRNFKLTSVFGMALK